jgi:hypothetical protein
MTVDLLVADADTRSVWLAEQGNRGEVSDTTVVIVIRDGFLDDSVRGDWHRIGCCGLGMARGAFTRCDGRIAVGGAITLGCSVLSYTCRV